MAQIVDLVLLEGSDKRSLILLEVELSGELAHSQRVQELDDIDLVSKLFRGSLVSLKPLDAPLEPA